MEPRDSDLHSRLPHLYDRYGGESVLVWAAILHLYIVNGKMTGQRYRDEIFLLVVIPTVQGPSFVFQHNNAPPHRAVISIVYGSVPDPNSIIASAIPHLSPMEHTWDVFGQR